MIILPAIDLKDGKCVRLFQGDYATAEQVAEDPVKTAQSFEEQGARWARGLEKIRQTDRRRH